MWLPPSCTKRGAQTGGGGEASVAPYPVVWDASGSWLGLFAWDITGDRVFPAPALLGEPPARIIQHEQSGWRQWTGRGKGGQGREGARESKVGAWKRVSDFCSWKRTGMDSGREQRGLES